MLLRREEAAAAAAQAEAAPALAEDCDDPDALPDTCPKGVNTMPPEGVPEGGVLEQIYALVSAPRGGRDGAAPPCAFRSVAPRRCRRGRCVEGAMLARRRGFESCRPRAGRPGRNRRRNCQMRRAAALFILI
jgi:hypothetical protein